MVVALGSALGACSSGSSPSSGSSSTSSPASTGNGEASKSASQVIQDARQATGGASSVRVHGQVRSSGSTVSLDISLSNKGGGGSISVDNERFEIIQLGQTVYVRTDQATLRRVTNNAAVAQLVGGRWLETTTANSDFKDLTQLTNLSSLVQGLSPQGSITKGSPTTVNGRQAVPLHDSEGATLYVSAIGQPYILEISAPSGTAGGSGRLTFDDYGTAVIPAAPANPINIDQLPKS